MENRWGKPLPITKINKLRKIAQSIAHIKEDAPEGWSACDFDPVKLLDAFTPLKLMDGFMLKAFLFRSGDNGNGTIKSFKSSDIDQLNFNDVDSLFSNSNDLGENIMECITGDGTPWSYLCASLFAREANEFGALWHGVSWGTHEILGKDPTFTPKTVGDVVESDNWEWRSRPEMWKPTVTKEGDSIRVKILTISELGTESIYLHTDTYKEGRYSFTSEEEIVATGQDGFIF